MRAFFEKSPEVQEKLPRSGTCGATEKRHGWSRAMVDPYATIGLTIARWSHSQTWRGGDGVARTVVMIADVSRELYWGSNSTCLGPWKTQKGNIEPLVLVNIQYPRRRLAMRILSNQPSEWWNPISIINHDQYRAAHEPSKPFSTDPGISAPWPAISLSQAPIGSHLFSHLERCGLCGFAHRWRWQPLPSKHCQEV